MSRAAGDASLIRAARGYALAWSERTGEHSALRFLVVDAQGIPLSPSAEVIDRPTPLGSPSIDVTTDGYVLAWSEGAARFQRPLDGRGRPRADVGDSSVPPPQALVSRCVTTGEKQVCWGEDRRSLELPAQARPLAEAMGPGALALIAQDGEGLRLWVLDCGAR